MPCRPIFTAHYLPGGAQLHAGPGAQGQQARRDAGVEEPHLGAEGEGATAASEAFARCCLSTRLPSEPCPCAAAPFSLRAPASAAPLLNP